MTEEKVTRRRTNGKKVTLTQVIRYIADCGCKFWSKPTCLKHEKKENCPNKPNENTPNNIN